MLFRSDNNAVREGNLEIDHRVAAATNNLDDIESIDDTPAEEHTDASDSTFAPSEESTDDSMMDDDSAPEISKVNSEDFEFNLANVHDLDDVSNARSTDTSSLDTYVTESKVIDLTQGPDTPHHSDTPVSDDSFQLMNIGEA